MTTNLASERKQNM